MNCEVNNADATALLAPVQSCSPYGFLGHISNCSELAEACYQGYIASPRRALGGSGETQTVYVGSVENNVEFEQCAQRVVGDGGRYTRGFTSNEGCSVGTNTTQGESNAAPSASALRIKKSAPAALTYLAMLLALLSTLSVASAAPTNASAPVVHKGRLTKVGHGSWSNFTVTKLGLGNGKQKRQYDICNSCDVFFWNGEGCTGDVFQFTQTEEPIDGDCLFEPGFSTCADPGEALAGFVGQNVWVSSAAPDSTAESTVTVDQTCPPTGPNVLASVKPRGGCVYLGPVYGGEGLTCYPGGGSPYRKRQGGNCNGFAIDNQYESQSTLERISDNIDCRTSAADCTIEASQQFSSTIESSWSTTAGVDAFGFSVSATFGQSYSESVSTGIAGTFTIPKGAAGFLGAYVPMTVFEGRFTDCDDGSEEPGQVFAIKDGPVSFRLVNTN